MTRARFWMAGALLPLLLAVGCSSDDGGDQVASVDGNGGNSGDETSADEAEPASEEEILDYFACLRENGVEVEDPTFDADGNMEFGGGGAGPRPGGFDRDAMEMAQEACGEIPAMPGGFGDRDQGEMEDQMLALAQCMRDHGIDMPDPDLGTGQGSPFGGGDIDVEDPAFQEAFDECRGTLDVPAPGEADDTTGEDG